MGRIRIITVNRADAVWDGLVGDYLQRIARYADIKWQVVKPTHGVDVAQIKRKNTEQLLALVPAGSLTVVLDELGVEWSTQQLSRQLVKWSDRYQCISFIVGGAEGLERERLVTHPSWALSRLTLPHRMAQLILVERLYRAFSMQHNHPYHRA